MIIKEFRIIMPMTVAEYEVAQLWSVAQASKNETGGGEGVEVLENHAFENHEKFGNGQYTHKIYHLASRVPSYAKIIAPKGSLEFHEKAWNAYPYCKTVVSNPDYMKDDNFELSIESWYKPDFGESENVHELSPELWKKTEVIHIDIANDRVTHNDYKAEEDPVLFTPKEEGRGPLTKDWIQLLKSKESGDGCSGSKMPHMCCYKLVKCHFKWFGLQNIIEKFVHKQERRIFNNFNRQVYCWMDKWHGLTMEDIRRIEDQSQEELREMRARGSIRGTKVTE